MPASPALRLVVADRSPQQYEELVAAAQRAEREGQCSEARGLYHQALKQLPAGQTKDASALFRWIGRTHQADGDNDAALECIEAALAIAKAHGDTAAIGHATNHQANVYWHLSDLDAAERLFHEAREIALSAGDTKLVAMTTQNLGTMAYIRGDVSQALAHFESSLRDYRTLGLGHDVCVALNNLGMLHTGQRRWAEAQTMYEEGLQIAGALGEVAMRIQIEVNYADHYVARGDFDQARVVADSVAELARRVGDHRFDGELEKTYGIIAREAGDYLRAEEHLTRAQEIAQRRADQLVFADATKAKADLHRRQGRNRDSLHCLNAAHRAFSQLRARLDVADVNSRVSRLESDFLDVVRRWSESIESKDHYTQGHCERVADLACALAARVGLDAQSLFWFRIGAMLHDVGKLLISSDVLNKPGPLTTDEWELVKQHPVHGVEMLAGVDFPWDVRPIVESHHERWDGAGYPHRLAAEQIPLSARILCIADVYDALTSERSYKRPLSHQEALDVMRLDVAKQFDPSLFPAFEEVATEIAAQHGRARLQIMRPLIETTVFAGTPADELTGLPLRRAFIERARTEIAARRDGSSLSLLIIDVDHFKLVNDTYGHLAGDAVLRDVTRTLRDNLRAQDFLARYAGDEFVILLPNTAAPEAMHVGEKLCEAIHELSFGSSRSAPVSTTISVGIAAAPEHGATVEELFPAADAALYEAKRKGRDGVVLAGPANGATRDPVVRIERFSGRREERARLTQLLDQTLHDGARIAAIVGEAGIGKSTLVRELSADVRMRAGSLVLGRCAEAGSRAPLAPWAGALKAIRVLRVVADRPWRHLPRLFGDPTSAAAPSDGSRFALFDEVAEYLRLAAATRPLVIALDDMHWADESSWDLLEHVLAHVDRDRILFCITLREEDTMREVRVRRTRLSRDGRFREIRLARMTAAEQREWVHQALGDTVGDDLLQYLFAQSEGNPFFSVQVLRAMLDEHRLHWNGSRWEWSPPTDARMPVAVSDLLTRRASRLSPSANRILSAAAVIGRAIDVDLAVRAGIGSEEQILDAIDEGLTGSVLEVSDVHGEHHIAFSHALLVDIMRETINPSRRKRLHERVAHAMEALRPDAAVEIAHHFELAGVRDKAFTYACLAAEQAAAVYAIDEALALLQSAERHTSDHASCVRVRVRRAALAEAAGRYREAETLHESVLGELFGGTNVVTRAESKRAAVRLRALQGAPPEKTRASCRALLAEAEVMQLDAERVALLLMLSHSYSLSGESAVAETMAQECLALAQRVGDRRLMADALTRVGCSIVNDRPVEATNYFHSAFELHQVTGDAVGQIRCHINLGVASSHLCDFDGAEAAYRRALVQAREIHAPDFIGLAALDLGVALMKRGRLVDARALLEEAHTSFHKVKNELHRIFATYNLAHLAREEQRFDDASRLYGATVALARDLGLNDVVIGATAGTGLMALAVDDLEEAEAQWQHATAEALPASPWFQGRELLDALAIRMCLLSGDTESAMERFERGIQIATDHDAYSAAWLVAATAPAIAERLAGDEATRLDGIARTFAKKAETLGSPALAAKFALLLSDVHVAASSDRQPQLLVS